VLGQGIQGNRALTVLLARDIAGDVESQCRPSPEDLSAAGVGVVSMDADEEGTNNGVGGEVQSSAR